MDPLTLIVSSLSAGAVAAAKTTVERVVKDTYEGIKSLIKKKFGNQVSIGELEKNPNSIIKRESLKEDLESVNASNDDELVQLAKHLIELINQYAPETEVKGINIEEVEAEFLKIGAVTSSGMGVNVKKSKFNGGIDIQNVKSGNINPI